MRSEVATDLEGNRVQRTKFEERIRIEAAPDGKIIDSICANREFNWNAIDERE
jgi:hypothetical protein